MGGSMMGQRAHPPPSTNQVTTGLGASSAGPHRAASAERDDDWHRSRCL